MKKLLFIRYKKPSSVLEGGEQVTQQSLNSIASILGEKNVCTYYIHDEAKKKNIGVYLKGILSFLQGYFFGLSKGRVSELVVQAQLYDYVYIDRSVFGIIAKELKRSGYQGEIISFYHNVELRYFEAKISKLAPWRSLVLSVVNKNDAYSSQYADKVIALNERDGDELKERYNRYPDLIIPVAFKDIYKKKTYTSEKTNKQLECLFVGSYFPANYEGLLWFIEQVYPHVDVKLTIVGKGMDQIKKSSLITNHINVYSSVPDLVPFYENADLIISPIFKGSGMKVKTCEALMYGKNILATTEAFEGYELDYDKVGGECNSVEEFIKKINDFQKSPRNRFNQYSREQYLKKYSETAVAQKFKNLFSF